MSHGMRYVVRLEATDDPAYPSICTSNQQLSLQANVAGGVGSVRIICSCVLLLENMHNCICCCRFIFVGIAHFYWNIQIR